MNPRNIPPATRDDPARERRHSLLGLVSSALLTGAAFALVLAQPFARPVLLACIAALALVQIGCQLFFFLHIDLRRSHRDDLQLVLFTSLVIVLMVAGSMWILSSQHAMMG
ncbi:cytochrome C oxidase subunit IV family protein [Novosphingobium profundi]|uniref:cytochrome o ubiquinol oxidase subunit IV n=1 Tax=Novosphingobium profundi TaxID=1774954 RepID=UPI001BDB3276|nr:cytochrome C oxidase subunit IV family protein [Novosphingobium profundi]MBT0670592.1 cytochrome C oxidase subunit IV family protein [Novosphingobium profundi]